MHEYMYACTCMFKNSVLHQTDLLDPKRCADELCQQVTSWSDAGLRIEEGTAKFYLDVADGNLKEAIALYGKFHFFSKLNGASR